MKIALISMPRVGSNSLFEMIHNHYSDFDSLHEPYVPFKSKQAQEFDVSDMDNLPDNFLYKGLIYQNPVGWKDRDFYQDPSGVHTTQVYGTTLNGIPKLWKGSNLKWIKLNWYDSDEYCIKFIEKIDTQYDKVIYLDGLDMDRIVKSYTIAYITNDWFSKTDYSVEYPEEKYVVSKSEDEKHWREYLTWYQQVLRYYANDDNYFTYEGIYKDKSEIEKLNNYLGVNVIDRGKNK